MKKTYKDEIAAAMHEFASDLYEVGVISKSTMREFDELCLTPVEKLSPEQIRAIREENHASQSVFARYLNVSPGVVSQWERGERAQWHFAQAADFSEKQGVAVHRLSWALQNSILQLK